MLFCHCDHSALKQSLRILFANSINPEKFLLFYMLKSNQYIINKEGKYINNK